MAIRSDGLKPAAQQVLIALLVWASVPLSRISSSMFVSRIACLVFIIVEAGIAQTVARAYVGQDRYSMLSAEPSDSNGGAWG